MLPECPVTGPHTAGGWGEVAWEKAFLAACMAIEPAEAAAWVPLATGGAVGSEVDRGGGGRGAAAVGGGGGGASGADEG
ncbi:hypothetical protein GX50_07689 [[Emmonsia] crescens]|uniref:Uncharacterized protein n=1 Tax=[Emmonsia] crescens TaxID=73230 RepID=A0A2B7Z9P8_9EURO|nr:hypothetical protein GX50_07689 [Emmonsia crescens]